MVETLVVEALVVEAPLGRLHLTLLPPVDPLRWFAMMGLGDPGPSIGAGGVTREDYLL